MKFISWNVNGLRACLGKGFMDFFNDMDADIFCLQETKMQKGQAEINTPGYYQYWYSAIKKGYSGTAVYTKVKPISVEYGIGRFNDEGRVITLEYEDFYLINCYTPNSQRGLLRLDYRMEFEDEMRAYLCGLKEKKPVVLCGDLNVAHNEIDIKNPKSNIKNAGFTYEERGKLTDLLAAGFTDSFRYMYPDKIAYTWWSYQPGVRERNVGWRIDYFLVSNNFNDSIKDSYMYTDIMGSDHCPVCIELT